MSETVVRCGKCDTLLAEPPDTPSDDRIPCPKCGSTARSFVVGLEATVVAQPDVVVQAPPATATASAAEVSVRITGATAKTADAEFRLEWLRLSEGGAWMVRVYDEKGTFVAGSIQDDPQDAILAVAEQLAP